MRLAAVLVELAPRTREMFLLNRLDGLSYTQLAASYGVSVSAEATSGSWAARLTSRL